MSKKLESMTVEELMAEADKLIRQIDSEFNDDMVGTKRQQLEKHAHDLKNIKAEAQDSIEKKGAFEKDFLAEGMHEAIQDIAKAFREFGKDEN